MGDTSQKQGSDQSHYDFLQDIAGQVKSLIKKNRPRFEQQVKKFETQYSDHRKVLMDAQRQARLKANSHLRPEPGKRAPEGYVLFDINEYSWQFPRKMVSCYILKSLLKLHPNPLDTLIERDKFYAKFNPWESQRSIDYNKNGEKVSDLPGEEICTKEEDELRQYYLLSVIHAYMTDDPAVVGRNSNPAMSVWDRFDYQKFMTITHMDRSGEKAFIQRALKDVQEDIDAINSKKPPKITKNEANIKAREILKSMSDDDRKKLTTRKLANMIPCSKSLADKLPAWIAVKGVLGKKKLDRPKEIRMTKKLESVIGTGKDGKGKKAYFPQGKPQNKSPDDND